MNRGPPYKLVIGLLLVVAGLWIISTSFSTNDDFCSRADPPSGQDVFCQGESFYPATFEGCIAAGNPILESYPRQCNTPAGDHFVEILAGENGYCETTVLIEDGEELTGSQYQSIGCGSIANPIDCQNGGSPEWLEKNAPFQCEWIIP